MSWGIDLWDQYDNISLHTHKGIDFMEKYGHFQRDRCSIELDYASKLRKLVKSYLPKKKADEKQFSCWTSFIAMLNETNDLAGQHEVIAENLTSSIIKELFGLVKELKEERKRGLNEAQKHKLTLQNQEMQLDKAKRLYEKSHKDSLRAKLAYERAEADLTHTLKIGTPGLLRYGAKLWQYERAEADLKPVRADVEKQKNTAQLKGQQFEDSKSDYATQLQKFNELQHQHYTTAVPQIYQTLQEMDEKRIVSFQDFMRRSVTIEKNVFPIIDTCLNGIVKAADAIDPKEDARLVIDRYKSGFSLDDLQGCDNSGDDERSSPQHLLPSAASSRSHRSERGFEILLCMVALQKAVYCMVALQATVRRMVAPQATVRRMVALQAAVRRMVALQAAVRRMVALQAALGRATHGGAASGLASHGGAASIFISAVSYVKLVLLTCAGDCLFPCSSIPDEMKEDYSDLPPSQRRKKLLAKLEGIQTHINQETAARDALQKMKAVYEENPALGDPNSLDKQLNENGDKLDKLRLEQQKFQSYLDEAENKLTPNTMKRSRNSFPTDNMSRSSSDLQVGGGGSARNSHMLQSPQNTQHESSVSPESGIDTTGGTNSDFDQGEFEDDYYQTFPVLGVAKALYHFDEESAASNEGSVPMEESEEFHVIEKDQGDGWTRVRKLNGEEGFVPSSYIEIELNNP
ncbi:PREDICTED: formin-binding protein 1-like [Priapulus caudatus]|uniref:Formin-binding protein 1-like n=1 Tax=Priapulus caudatus TaxID=37621 RepID=A0ABM1E6E7_PRICU|nr:PREDICTED: formin-binding protein 1-like [Priapulus caudatus]